MYTAAAAAARVFPVETWKRVHNVITTSESSRAVKSTSFSGKHNFVSCIYPGHTYTNLNVWRKFGASLLFHTLLFQEIQLERHWELFELTAQAEREKKSQKNCGSALSHLRTIVEYSTALLILNGPWTPVCYSQIWANGWYETRLWNFLSHVDSPPANNI